MRPAIRGLLYLLSAIAVVFGLAFPLSAAATLTSITPLTWDVIGLDHNNPTTDGPQNFPVGARVCSDVATPSVSVQFVWDSTNANLNLRSGSLNPIPVSFAAAGCKDVYFEVTITRTAAAFDTFRQYHIAATDSLSNSISTPMPRQLYVEKLVSQNRNSITGMTVNGVSIPAGGAMNLVVGNTYTIAISGSTAPGGYGQIEAFINMPNTIFRVLSVSSTYTQYVPLPGGPGPTIDRLYYDACVWVADPTNGNYRSCTTTGDAGGDFTTTYSVYVFSGAGTSQTLNTLVYDFSGNSYHYNSDFSTGARVANITGPTHAVIAGVHAYVEDGRTWVEWETASEIGTAAFNLLRRDPARGGFLRLNERPLPALIGTPQGGVYRYPDPDAVAGGTYTYGIEEVEARGNIRRLGPYKVVVGAAKPAAPAAKGPTLATADEAAGVRPDRYERTAHALNGRKAAAPSTASAIPAATSAATAVRILVEHDGVYAVTVDQIAAALGMTPQKAKSLLVSGQMRLRQGGQPVASMVDSSRGQLYFYGQAPQGVDRVYTRHNVYWLDNASDLAMKVVRGAVPGPVSGGLPFQSQIHAEENGWGLPFLASDPDADFWYWSYVVAPGASDFDVSAPDPVAGGDATLTAYLQGATDGSPGNDHRVHLLINGEPVGDVVDWNGITPRVISASFPAVFLAADGNNKVTVAGDLMPDVPYSVFWVNGFDLDYPRAFRASDDQLRLRGAGNRVVTIGGFSDSNIVALDISNPRQPQWLAASNVTSSGGSYAVSFVPATATADYFVAVAKAPFAVEGAAPSKLKSNGNGANYLVITPGSLRAGADALAAYRSAMGAKVVELQDIYDEFSYGIANPHAIHDFLAYAYQNWQPRPGHVALVGKGSFDPKHYKSYSTNLFPVLMTGTPYGLVAADNRYGDFDDSGVPKLAIGRVSAYSSDDVTNYVAKLTAYENNRGPANQALLAADYPSDAGDFTTDSDEVAAALQARGFEAPTVYLEDVKDTGLARQAIIEGLNSARGVGLFNYVGHGAVQALADSLFANWDVSELSNGTRLPVFLAFTCTAGDGSYPGIDSLSETLLWGQGGGAIASFASTALSDNAQAHILNLEMVDALVGTNARPTLGEAAVAAIARLKDQGGERYMLETYQVIGDPALKLHP